MNRPLRSVAALLLFACALLNQGCVHTAPDTEHSPKARVDEFNSMAKPGDNPFSDKQVAVIKRGIEDLQGRAYCPEDILQRLGIKKYADRIICIGPSHFESLMWLNRDCELVFGVPTYPIEPAPVDLLLNPMPVSFRPHLSSVPEKNIAPIESYKPGKQDYSDSTAVILYFQGNAIASWYQKPPLSDQIAVKKLAYDDFLRRHPKLIFAPLKGELPQVAAYLSKRYGAKNPSTLVEGKDGGQFDSRTGQPVAIIFADIWQIDSTSANVDAGGMGVQNASWSYILKKTDGQWSIAKKWS